MIDKERKVVDDLMGHVIEEKDFVHFFYPKIKKDSRYVIRLLEQAYQEKNGDDVELSLYVGFVLEVFTKEYVPILCKLFLEKWHTRQEDIASLFQELKDPRAIEVLYQGALTKFVHFEYNDSYSFIVKCCWALGDINTVESRKKLELLAQSDNKIIKDAAIEQLNRKHKVD